MSSEKLITELQETYKDLTQEEWLAKIKYRGLEHKHEWQLQALVKFYPVKISRVANSIFIPDPLLSPEENKKQQLEFEWYKKQKLARLKDKLAAVLKEIEFRNDGIVKREPIGTTYYLDFDGATGNLTGTWTFTNGSTTVSGSGGAATSELAAGDYVRVSNGSEWYKVTSVTDDNNFEITPAFQQATVTDAADSSKYNNYDGTATTTPFVHLNQYTTDTARSPGDVLKVRANQTHLYAGIDIVFDEGGNADNMIEIRGCSSTDDPWGDGSDVKPIIGFGDTAYQLYLYSDDFWKMSRLELIESSSSYGIVRVRYSHNSFFNNCIFRDASSIGVYLIYSGNTLFQDCSFYSNSVRNLYSDGSRFKCEGCAFDGGAATTDYGIDILGSFGELITCSFGASSSHDIHDIFFSNAGARIFARNCSFAGTISFSTSYAQGAILRSEDHNQTKGAHQTLYFNGTIEKDTSVVRSGGASSSAKMTPNSNCGLYYPLTIADDFCAGDFKLWLPAEQKTVTIYLRTFGYTTFPTADELYIEASYLDEATGGHRATVKSTQTVSANDTWTAFSVTFTPAQEGWVYVTVYLKKYEADSGVYVDIKPVIS
ncbi:MAG: hypothetical protein DRI61_02670 [Chloroflexi bacterium]|nr:MAG: hypothetical protein DRI61_02670 [Chloroflexota bacterium]